MSFPFWSSSQTRKHIYLKHPQQKHILKNGDNCANQFGMLFFWSILGGGFKYFVFSPLLGEMIQIDKIIFFKWVAQPPTTLGPQKPMEKWRFWTPIQYMGEITPANEGNVGSHGSIRFVHFESNFLRCQSLAFHMPGWVSFVGNTRQVLRHSAFSGFFGRGNKGEKVERV